MIDVGGNDHYDFGLRAVKSVLVMAGNLKRSSPELDENIVLIRAMRDSNVPKFLAKDLPLFHALIQDLFPEASRSTIADKQPPSLGRLDSLGMIDVTNTTLESTIKEALRARCLQEVPATTAKTIQLFETLNTRFGVMLVGPAGGGKTTAYRVLADAMSRLRKEGSTDLRMQEVKCKVLNPRAIGMTELYGSVDPETQDWNDGLASKILRKFSKLETDRRSWCVFDGPVDALWVENMNSVLDDNMLLSLTNGERIKLNSKVRVLFEVQDLAQASLATVSRCGMVYLCPTALPWRPIFQSWIESYILPNKLLKARQVKYLTELFDAYVDPLIREVQ